MIFLGAFCMRVTPVPIPNTEVKTHSAYGTAGIFRGRVGLRQGSNIQKAPRYPRGFLCFVHLCFVREGPRYCSGGLCRFWAPWFPPGLSLFPATRVQRRPSLERRDLAFLDSGIFPARDGSGASLGTTSHLSRL